MFYALFDVENHQNKSRLPKSVQKGTVLGFFDVFQEMKIMAPARGKHTKITSARKSCLIEKNTKNDVFFF